MSSNTSAAFRPWNVFVAPGSPAEAAIRSLTGQPLPSPDVREPGIPSTPAHDLLYNGGKTIPDLVFTNLYVGGEQAWTPSDIQQIDQALAAAMTDARLNNVMAQYFPNQGIRSAFVPSRVLPGPPPAIMSQGDVENLMANLYTQNALTAFDLSRTVFNVLLPSGAVLNTDTTLTQATDGEYGDQTSADSVLIKRADTGNPASIAEDSLNGLGGYHGSIHVRRAGGGQDTLYYAIGAYSEVLPDGRTNGIVAFDTPWKNVVATFYHELNEARTDADVEDAIQTGDSSLTGWVSAQGEECGDFPVFEANPLSLVFQEVTLTDGSGTVPVQFQYSNAVHGPEGPISTPHAPAR